MVKMGMNNGEFCDLLTNLLRAMWKEERVLQEWVDTILIPIPKKENLIPIPKKENFEVL